MIQRRVRVALIGLVSCIEIGLAACAGTQAPQNHADIATAANARQACASKRPPYPDHARRAGEQGVVRVAVLVGADGSFLKGEVRKSSGSRELDQATIAAASGWCWKPSTENGMAVEKWQEFSYTWQLD